MVGERRPARGRTRATDEGYRKRNPNSRSAAAMAAPVSMFCSIRAAYRSFGVMFRFMSQIYE